MIEMTNRREVRMAKSNRRGRGEALGSVPSRALRPLPGQAALCSADLGGWQTGPWVGIPGSSGLGRHGQDPWRRRGSFKS